MLAGVAEKKVSVFLCDYADSQPLGKHKARLTNSKIIFITSRHAILNSVYY